MFNKNKLIFALLSVLLFIPPAQSQGQDSFEKFITDKFEKFRAAVPREEIYIQTDRNEYISGEEVWLKAYLIDRQSGKLTDESRIAYLELLNMYDQPVIQKRIKLSEGTGPGEMVLPDTLSTGNYTLRAYTNWMRNFLPLNCFMKKINIYNAINTGNIITNRINSANDLLKQVEPADSAAAPEKDFELQVNNPGTGIIQLVAVSNDYFRARNGSTCYLFIHTHGIINLIRTLDLNDKYSFLNIPVETFIPGINHITVFDSGRRPIAEKFVYTAENKNQLINISSPDSCQRRDNISMDIRLGEIPEGSADSSSLSVSIVPKNGSPYFPDLKDYMVFGSEFGPLPDDILDKKLDEIPSQIMNKFLLTLKSNWIDWNVILSGDYPAVSSHMEKEYQFLTGRLIRKDSGLPESNKFMFLSSPGKQAIFQYAKTDNNGRYTFGIPLNEEIKNIIIQPERDGNNYSIEVGSAFSDKILSTNDSLKTQLKQRPDYIWKWGANYQIQKIYGIIYRSNPVLIGGSLLRPIRFYGKPDITLMMDDYIKLPVMEEVFFELLPGVFLRERRSGYEIYVVDAVGRRISDTPPILMIDGVVIDDPAIIANFNPDLVEEIDVVKEKYYVGDYLFNGIVNVITRDGDLSSITLPDYAVQLRNRVTDPVALFNMPDYSDPKVKMNTLPDFRNTLFWNPSVSTTGNKITRIEFPASDYTGDYEVNIQGITDNGDKISFKKNIRIY
jgi:hypothetical protein